MKLESNKTNRQNIEDIYPLSPMQEGMLFESLYAPDSGAYFQQLSCILTGNLDVKTFEQAWQQVVAKHSILRTAFLWESLSQSIQIVYRQVNVTINTYDWRKLSVQKQQQQLETFLNSERQKGFQLSQAPLMRLHLIQLDGNIYQFVWCYHHLLLDGWSSSLVFKDLLEIYQLISQGKTLQLQSTVSYRNYIAWLKQQNQDLAAEFWRQKLQGFTTPTPLTVDKSLSMRDQHSGYRERQIHLTVPATAAIVSFVRQHQLTLSNLVQATWGLLLSRYSQETDVVFGATVSGRPPELAGVESMVGLFINTLPVRVQIQENTELLVLLKDLQNQQVESEQYSYSSLVDIQGLSDVPRGTSLFESIVVFENYPVDSAGLQSNSDFTISNVHAIEQTNYPLAVLVAPGEQLLLKVMYDASRFEDSTISRMLDHFVTMLEGIVANPTQPISQLPILTATEKQQLLVDWNNTQVDYPQDKCIHQLVEEQVERTPDAVAVIFENQQLTYHELNCRANQLANYLQTLGVKPDVLVGICVERSLEMVVGLLGILKAGGAYVPLDSDYPSERLAFMLEDADVAVLLTQQKLVEKLPKHQARLVYLDTNAQELAQASEINPASEVKPSNLAYVLYTSGSTGRPKAVAIEHHSPVALVNWAQKVFTPEELAGVLASTSICFDLSVFEFFVTLSLRGKVILAQNALHLSTISTASQVTLINTVPSAITQLIRDNNIPPQVCTVNLAGEALQDQLVQQIYQHSQVERVFNLYGPSEDTTYSTFSLIEKGTSGSSTIGRPISNTQIYILNKYLQPVPVGVPGELHISGAGLARGYLNRPELTKEKFINNPFDPLGESRLYKTGDLARYLPDGNIEYLGRIDNQVKIRGFRIELGEIEAALTQHSNVQTCCVIAREDNTGDKRLVAYIVAQPQTTSNKSELRQFLSSKLPQYMVPAAIVTLDALPLTLNGKVNRRALPAPEPSSELLAQYVAPRTPIEEILTVIWQQVLKLERVGRHDNFFELGGHSLLATQLVSRVRSSLKVELPLRSLFTAPTIAELSLLIQQLQQQDSALVAPPIVSRTENAELSLSFAQQRLWFLEKLNPNSASYNIPFGLRLVGHLNVAALEQSFKEIIQRHEALRTNFVTVDGKPTQIIQLEPYWQLAVVDLQHLSISDREKTAQELVQQQAVEPFDLASDALIRATLIVLSDTQHWLNVSMHHVISDGWSMGVFVSELTALYNAYSIGQPSPLLPLTIQYADFAIWQREWLVGEVLQSQLSYWKQQLANAPTFLGLPTDRPRPAVQTFNGAYQEFSLSFELTQKLEKLSQQQGVTLFMTLLAAYNTLLYRYTGQEDILVGTPIANRDRTELEGLIGFFVNTLVMRTNLAENPSFSELLSRIREMALGAYAHQDLPFEMLVEALQPERDMSHTPLFQVMFVLQNTPVSEIELSGLSASDLPIESSTAKFDITLVMENTANGIVGWWEYNTDLFDSSTIKRMIGHFVTLLEGIVANPSQQISQLPMLTASEQQQLLVEWNDTQSNYPQDKCIHQLFEKQAELTPDHVAVVFDNQLLTYHQLNCRANQLAHYLQYEGVRPDVLVGICVERSLEMIVALLAILKAGGAYVPLDPEYPTERLRFMLEDAQVSVLLSQQQLLERLPEYQAKLICLDEIWSEILQNKQDNPIEVVTANNLANVIYTSGSTGKPKGVMVEHSGLCNLAQAQIQAFSLNSESRILQFASFSFDACISEILMAFGSGARLYLGTKDSIMPGMPLIERLSSDGITHVILPPSALAVLPTAELPSLQTIIVAGEACPAELIKTWSVGRNFINAYGPTEASVCATTAKCTPEDNKVTIGRPIANVQVYILDTQLKPVPIGVPGELYIGGAGVARGYLHQRELTQQKFIPNPFNYEPDSRLYKTGDLARYLTDGNIEYLGRIDNQVKIRGFRIELGEIESILSQHPGVRENVVVATEDMPGEKRLVAYFVPQLEQTLTTNELRIFLKEKLPQYMLPSAFVRLEFLPLTPNGKVDRKALPVPDVDNTQLAVTFVAPRTPVEKVLADIWANVLHLEQVGVLDNFFDLGGHSLTTIQVISQVNETFQIQLPLRHLFTAPTICELAQTIEFTSRVDSTVSTNEITTVNLQAEVVLDETIKPGNLVYQPVSEPAAIFLTGATGFVGAFLLAELLQQTQADIYCLVRAANLTAGKQRLQETLKAYLVWEESFNSRIIPVLGDLSQPLLGLCDEQFHLMALKIDSIYHNGALVNNIYPYSLFKAANVRGTEEILRLASQIKIKPVHFISTASVFASNEYFKLEVVLENDPLEHCQGLLGGYTQSKWVAEKMIMIARDRGLPCSIYRLGRVTWHSQTGVWNPNDLFYRFIKSCIQLKSAPEIDSMEKITPVDYLTKALIHLSQQPESLGKAFHLISSHSASWSQFMNCMHSFGYPLQQLSYENWQAELLRSTQISTDNALYSFVSLTGDNTSSESRENGTPSLKFDCQNTLNGLANTTIRWPEVDDKLLQALFANFSNWTLNKKK